jgi:NTP pyrophosphatase (non-canonical NTP hydrolase)
MIFNSNQPTKMTTQELIEAIRTWGTDRNIIGANAKATTQTQFVKLLEEVEELNVAIAIPDHAETIDAIGDCTVVLILLANLAGVKFEDCLQSAYDEIKGRTGHMSADGVFVKDAPSDDDFDEPLPERACTDSEVCESCQ